MSSKKKKQLKGPKYSHVEVTHVSPTLKIQLRSVEPLRNSLSAGSKNRLDQYRRNLAVTRGRNDPEFDEDVLNVLQEYCFDKSNLREVTKYLSTLKDKDGVLFSRNFKLYSATEESFRRFAEKDYTSFRWNRSYQKSLEEVRSEIIRWRLKVCRFNSDDDVRSILPKLDTHSGYYWILTGKKEKGDNLEGILRELKRTEALIRERGRMDYPILVAFRTQGSGEIDDDGSFTNTCKHKTRVVSMIDLRQILIELRFAKSIQEKMAQVQWYAGGKSEVATSRILNGFRGRNRFYESIDYSNFDQTIPSWLIRDAFDILSEAFAMNDEEKQLWDAVVESFVKKTFVLNEGCLYSVKGIPSGSMFTQIIGSLCNRIMITCYLLSIGEVSRDMITMGDDNCFFTQNKVDMKMLSSYLMKNFGVTVKVDDKSTEGTTNEDPKFLSRVWTHKGTWRHPNQLLSRMLYPERERKYNEEITPYHVVFAFILTYPMGMRQLMNVGKFLKDHPISEREIWDKVDNRYLPGALAYIRNYT